jgi:SAM-dependent methyltransferase
MMEAKAVDAVEFRDGQRKQWNTAATGWRKWSELIDDAASGISERLVELAGVEPGSRVLDVAAGYGEPALSAATRAGSSGKVVATDISKEMLAYGRERAATAGLDNIEFVESDAASLEFPPDSFDAALSRWGIIFEPMERPPPATSAASSSRALSLRSAPGDRPSASRSLLFRCGRRCSTCRFRRRRPARPGRSRARRLRRSAGC